MYDVLDCGHRETHDVMSKKRRCRTCADPTFPGIDTTPVEVARPEVPMEALPLPPTEQPSSIPLVLTVDEVADLLRVNRKTIYKAAIDGEIPGVRRIGHRTVRFYGPALARWLETGTGAGQGRRSRR